jgi:hypothetical protein
MTKKGKATGKGKRSKTGNQGSWMMKRLKHRKEREGQGKRTALRSNKAHAARGNREEQGEFSCDIQFESLEHKIQDLIPGSKLGYVHS